LLSGFGENFGDLALCSMHIDAGQVARLDFDEGESRDLGQFAGDEGLAAAGRAVEQDAVWQIEAILRVNLRLLKGQNNDVVITMVNPVYW